MSVLIYNCIQIDVLQTLRYRREPVYDGRTYLYTRHFVHVRGVIDPNNTAYDFTAQSKPNVIDERRGQAAPDFRQRGVARVADLGGLPQNANLSDRAARHLLAQPRKKLLYYSGGVDVAGNPRLQEQAFPPLNGGQFQDAQILESPYRNRGGGDPQYTVDANYGPNPLLFDVWRIDGTGTFRVEFAVETWVNEAHLFRLKPPVLLCNEWEMDHDVDAEGFTVQTVRGRAKFRADVLEQQRTRPDDYRSFLLLPVPQGFKREALRLRAADDGTTLHYQFTDRQQSHGLYPVLVPRGNQNAQAAVARVEAFASMGENWPNAEDVLKAIVGLIAAVKFRSAAGILAAGHALPARTVNMVVRVWGNPAARRGDLVYFAWWVIFAKLPVLLSKDIKLASSSQEITADLMGRYVEVNVTFTVSGLTKALTEPAMMFSEQTFGRALFQEDEITVPANTVQGQGARIPIADAGLTGATPTPPLTADYTWPLNRGDRGNFLRLCVAAALSEWQDGPDVTTRPQPQLNSRITPNY